MVDVSIDSEYKGRYRIVTDNDECIVGIRKEDLKEIVMQSLKILLEKV